MPYSFFGSLHIDDVFNEDKQLLNFKIYVFVRLAGQANWYSDELRLGQPKFDYRKGKEFISSSQRPNRL